MYDVGPQAVAPGSDNIFPRFYRKAVHLEARSNAEGRPVYEDKEYVEISIGGDKNTQVNRVVKDEDRERWAPLYAKFKAGLEQSAEGTPLEQWSLLSPAQVEMYKALRIPTIEVMAGVSDAHLLQMGPGARQIRDRAKLHVEQAAGAAPVLALQTLVEQMQAQMAVMAKTIEEQAAALQRTSVKEAAE